MYFTRHCDCIDCSLVFSDSLFFINFYYTLSQEKITLVLRAVLYHVCWTMSKCCSKSRSCVIFSHMKRTQLLNVDVAVRDKKTQDLSLPLFLDVSFITSVGILYTL